MTDMPRILVCDDEEGIRDMLIEYLGKRGFDAVGAANSDEMRSSIEEAPADLILLDINMPGEDGLSALRGLRTSDKTPVMMLTAAGETIDKIIGLEMGADDYLGKPVDLRELEARIKAILRRGGPEAPLEAAKASVSGSIGFAGFTLDLDGAKLAGPEGEEIELTAMEFRLLKLFVENRGRVLNRDQILEQAHDRPWDPFDRSIDIRISRLRRKLEINPQKPTIIRTVRGIGYVFDPEG